MEDDLTDEEMLSILRSIARGGKSATAQIAAIRLLREIGAGEITPAAGFAALDGPPGVRLKAV